MAVYHKMEPRSEEWFLARLGIPTASEFHRILNAKGELVKPRKASGGAAGYAYELMAEAMCGHPLEHYESEFMNRGQELEDAAILAYEAVVGVETLPGGFVTNDDGSIGCSPDRLVGDDGILEIKCPAPWTHVGYLMSREIEEEKMPQVQGQLFVTGRKWVDLISYHPELPLHVSRVVRNEDFIERLRVALEVFVEQLNLMRRHLSEKYGAFPEIKPKVVERRDPEWGIDDSDMAHVDQIIAREFHQ